MKEAHGEAEEHGRPDAEGQHHRHRVQAAALLLVRALANCNEMFQLPYS